MSLSPDQRPPDHQDPPRSGDPREPGAPRHDAGSSPRNGRPAPDTPGHAPTPADEAAPPAAYDEVYDELRAMARQRLAAERAGHTLQATALAHEAYLRLSARRAEQAPPASGTGDWDSRAHFFGAAARAMQQVLLDHARARGRKKRVGGRQRLPLSVADLAVNADLERVLEVQDAVDRLGAQDPRLAEIVRLRFYAGLDEADTAAALDVSPRTVRRDWALARAWLGRELDGELEG